MIQFEFEQIKFKNLPLNESSNHVFLLFKKNKKKSKQIDSSGLLSGIDEPEISGFLNFFNKK